MRPIARTVDDGNNPDLRSFDPVHQPIWSDKDLTAAWIIHLRNIPARLRKLGNLVSSFKQAIDKQRRAINGVRLMN